MGEPPMLKNLLNAVALVMLVSASIPLAMFLIGVTAVMLSGLPVSL